MAGTAENEPVGVVIEDGCLDGAGLEIEGFLRPFGDGWDCDFWRHFRTAVCRDLR